MLTRKQLRRLHGEGLPLHILEQDYIQALYLQEIYQNTEDLVFKGGTYLKHAYGLDRFSEDLDFTSLGEGKMKNVLEGSASALSDYGVEAGLSGYRRVGDSITCLMRYRGPLFDGTERSIGAIHVEVSTRKDIVLDPVWERLFFEYPETRVVNVLGLRKEEALAEKLRALGTREMGRDLYDAWFLMKQGTEIQRTIFEEKMRAVNRAPVVRIGITNQEWRTDLEVLLVHPPDYHRVLKDVVEGLGQAGIEVSPPPNGGE